jgi:hypothetical protein
MGLSVVEAQRTQKPRRAPGEEMNFMISLLDAVAEVCSKATKTGASLLRLQLLQ